MGLSAPAAINTGAVPQHFYQCTQRCNKAFVEYLLNVMNRDRLNHSGDEHNDTEMLAFAGKGYAS